MQNRVVSHEDWLKGEMFHTYSCHGRGIDIVNGAYHFLDLVPKGREREARHDEILGERPIDIQEQSRLAAQPSA
jgi:predicted dithiol-disulfide oxidoreductase (DUF899 family)